jgi:hypothetical protein
MTTGCPGRGKPGRRREADMTEDPGQRPEQHGPEMDDTQVEATGELRDQLPPVTDDDESTD